MPAQPDMARLARAIGEPTRIGMLTLLMEGRALTAKELAFGAGVRPSTGTTHLRRLVDDSLVIVARQGRHKYFRLASPDVARCVESLMSVASPVRETKAGPDSPLREARLCYDHLAGCLGMQITDALLARRLRLPGNADHGGVACAPPAQRVWPGIRANTKRGET